MPDLGIRGVSSPIEVEQIWPRNGNIEIVASLHGLAPDGLSVALVLRDGPDTAVRRRVQPRGDGFTVTYSAEVLALACPDGGGCWDAYLEGEGGLRRRMGRHRDDIRNKRKIMIYPGLVVPGRDTDVMVKPRYTVEDNVSIDCLPVVPEESR